MLYLFSHSTMYLSNTEARPHPNFSVQFMYVAKVIFVYVWLVKVCDYLYFHSDSYLLEEENRN